MISQMKRLRIKGFESNPLFDGFGLVYLPVVSGT